MANINKQSLINKTNTTMNNATQIAMEKTLTDANTLLFEIKNIVNSIETVSRVIAHQESVFDLYHINNSNKNGYKYQRAIINQYLDLLKQGYLAQSKLRELLTGQTINYHIVTKKGMKSTTLTAEQYVKTWNINANKMLYLFRSEKPTEKISFLSPMTQKFQNTNGNEVISNKQDNKLFNYIYQYYAKGGQVNSGDINELYQYIKATNRLAALEAAYNNKDQNPQVIIDANTEFEAYKSQKYVTETGRHTSMYSLEFFRGGDIVSKDTNGNLVITQEKLTNAGVNINTIISELKQIAVISNFFQKDGINKIKSIFTFEQQIADSLFKEANEEAKNNIKRYLDIAK